MGFGYVDLIFVVLICWVDCDSFDDFVSIVCDFCVEYGFCLCIVMKYYWLVWVYFFV